MSTDLVCYVCKDEPHFRPFCSRCGGTGKHTPGQPLGLVNDELQAAMLNPATQVMFRAGLLACREYMASFVEQGGDKDTAASIRANWWPALGPDPGRPRRGHWDEYYEGEYPSGRVKTKEEVSPSTEALIQAMLFLHKECGWPITHPCFGEIDAEAGSV
jgi:hypothetical protein